MKPKIGVLCAALLIFSSIFHLALGQNFPVSGKVTSKISGEALGGATVVLKGSNIATSADANGGFTIKGAKKGSVLVISHIGMKPVEVAVNDNSNITVVMEESAENTLQDVVVNVGYGTQKKSVVTGAISSVKARDLEKVPSGRIEQTLQGRVSGVIVASNSGQPGTASTVRVRGVTTFSGAGNNPLYVVDGTVVDNSGISYLNQTDFESVEVLKDATSAAIYGTRAATGVILITTKKGKAGKMTVGYNGFYGQSAPAKVLDLLNATQYAALLNEKSVAGGGNVIFPDLGSLGKGTDWQDAIFNYHARRYSHEVNLSGGNDKSTFYLSFGQLAQDGIVATDISNYKRTTIRLNSTHKISKIFTLGQTLGYAHQKSSGIGNTNSEFGGPLSSAINLDPISPLIIQDQNIANAAPYSVNPVVRDADGNPYGISSLVGQEMTNPKAYIQTRLGGYSWSDDVVGNAFLEVNIIKGLKFKSMAGGKLSYFGDQAFTPVYFLSATNQVTKNNFSKGEHYRRFWNLENTLTYTRRINEHNFTILVGQGAYEENIGSGSNVTIYDLPITSYKDASFQFDIPSTNRVSSAYSTDGNINNNVHRNNSLFGRVNYDYKEKYLFTGIIRKDGSSRFGKNKKYGIFPSFSLGWVVSNEGFWKPNTAVNSLKIRGGYGKVGNDNIGEYGYLSTVVGGSNYTLGNSGAIITGYAQTSLDNPDLHWEQTSQANFGFDARLFNDFTLTLDLYNKKTTGILRPITIPGYVGVSSRPLGNVADMENRGVEIELGYRKKLGEVNFYVNGNLSYLENKVTYVASDANFINGDASFQSMGTVTRLEVGHSINSYYGFKTQGIFQNQAEIDAYTNKDGIKVQPNAKPGDFRWQDTDGNGIINDLDKIFLGPSLPKWTFGLTLNAEYKGFDIMAFAQGATGNKIFQGLRRLDIGNANYQTKAMSRWTGEGTSNSYPRLTSNDANGNFGKMSDFYLEKGDYLRLKILQLGYSFNRGLISKIHAEKIRIYVTAENLLTLTKYTGYDPEIGGAVLGVDKGVYPQARSFIGGIQVQF